MIDIETLRKYYMENKVIYTLHSSKRIRQREIQKIEIREIVMTGEIIEQYPDDYPYPSCLIYGITDEEKIIHVVMSDSGSNSQIITAYIPDLFHWKPDWKTRRERKE